MKNKGGKYFWHGIKHKISLCCIMFFENEWQSVKKQNSEYGKTMDKLTNNQGIILCPDCVVKRITNFSLRSELT